MGFDSKCDFTPSTIFLGLLLCSWMWGISSQLLECDATAALAPTILLGLLCPWTWGISPKPLLYHIATTQPVPQQIFPPKLPFFVYQFYAPMGWQSERPSKGNSKKPKMDGSWWRVLKKRGQLEKGKANHFNILALRTQ